MSITRKSECYAYLLLRPKIRKFRRDFFGEVGTDGDGEAGNTRIRGVFNANEVRPPIENCLGIEADLEFLRLASITSQILFSLTRSLFVFNTLAYKQKCISAIFGHSNQYACTSPESRVSDSKKTWETASV